MTFKFGLEQEFFVFQQDGKLTEVPKDSKLPFDESGYLAEARGKPANSVRDAVYLLMAEADRIKGIALREKLELVNIPLATIPNDVRLRIRRRFGKGTNSYENLYGFTSHRNRITEGTAGIHLSVTNQHSYQRYVNGTNSTEYYNAMWDFVQLFRFLDIKFKEDIKLAKRNPGFYEIKSDGRIEYRSLPANIYPLTRISDAVEEFLENK